MSTLETANGIAEHEQTVKTEPKKELPDELPSRSPRKSLLQQSPEPRRKSRRSSAASARVRKLSFLRTPSPGGDFVTPVTTEKDGISDNVLYRKWERASIGKEAWHGKLGKPDLVEVLQELPGSDVNVATLLATRILDASEVGQTGLLAFATFRVLLEGLVDEHTATPLKAHTRIPADELQQQAEDIFDLCEDLDEIGLVSRGDMAIAFQDLGLDEATIRGVEAIIFDMSGKDMINRSEFVQMASDDGPGSGLSSIFSRISVHDILARDGGRFFDSVDQDLTGTIRKSGMKELVKHFRPDDFEDGASLNFVLVDMEPVLNSSQYADGLSYCNREQFIEGIRSGSLVPFLHDGKDVDVDVDYQRLLPNSKGLSWSKMAKSVSLKRMRKRKSQDLNDMRIDTDVEGDESFSIGRTPLQEQMERQNRQLKVGVEKASGRISLLVDANSPGFGLASVVEAAAELHSPRFGTPRYQPNLPSMPDLPFPESSPLSSSQFDDILATSGSPLRVSSALFTTPHSLRHASSTASFGDAGGGFEVEQLEERMPSSNNVLTSSYVFNQSAKHNKLDSPTFRQTSSYGGIGRLDSSFPVHKQAMEDLFKVTARAQVAGGTPCIGVKELTEVCLDASLTVALNRTHVSQVFADTLLKELDDTNDGSLDFEEFCRAFQLIESGDLLVTNGLTGGFLRAYEADCKSLRQTILKKEQEIMQFQSNEKTKDLHHKSEVLAMKETFETDAKLLKQEIARLKSSFERRDDLSSSRLGTEKEAELGFQVQEALAENQRKSMEFNRVHIELSESSNALAEKASALRLIRDELSNLQERHDVLNSEYTSCRKTVVDTQMAYADQAEELAATLDDRNDLEKRLAFLQTKFASTAGSASSHTLSTSPSPESGSHGDGGSSNSKASETKWKSLQDELAAQRKALLDLVAQRDAMNDALATKAGTLEKQRLENSKAQAARHVLEQNLKACSDELENANARWQEQTKTIATLRKTILQLKFDGSAKSAADATIQSLRSEIERLRGNTISSSALRAVQRERDQFERQLTMLEGELNERELPTSPGKDYIELLVDAQNELSKFAIILDTAMSDKLQLEREIHELHRASAAQIADCNVKLKDALLNVDAANVRSNDLQREVEGLRAQCRKLEEDIATEHQLFLDQRNRADALLRDCNFRQQTVDRLLLDRDEAEEAMAQLHAKVYDIEAERDAALRLRLLAEQEHSDCHAMHTTNSELARDLIKAKNSNVDSGIETTELRRKIEELERINVQLEDELRGQPEPEVLVEQTPTPEVPAQQIASANDTYRFQEYMRMLRDNAELRQAMALPSRMQLQTASLHTLQHQLEEVLRPKQQQQQQQQQQQRQWQQQRNKQPPPGWRSGNNTSFQVTVVASKSNRFTNLVGVSCTMLASSTEIQLVNGQNCLLKCPARMLQDVSYNPSEGIVSVVLGTLGTIGFSSRDARAMFARLVQCTS